jgi:hypothetical protein
MIALAFLSGLSGLIVGAGAMLLLAFWIASRPKVPQQSKPPVKKSEPGGINVTGIRTDTVFDEWVENICQEKTSSIIKFGDVSFFQIGNGDA